MDRTDLGWNQGEPWDTIEAVDLTAPAVGSARLSELQVKRVTDALRLTARGVIAIATAVVLDELLKLGETAADNIDRGPRRKGPAS